MRSFYTHRLRISTRQLQTMQWNDVVERLVALHRRHRIQLNRAEITAHDIACRIMRRENYLIAMYNKQVFDLRVPAVYQIKNRLYRHVRACVRACLRAGVRACVRARVCACVLVGWLVGWLCLLACLFWLLAFGFVVCARKQRCWL